LSEKETLERVTNQLVELKDVSELAMDLAYSSLLLNNTYLAEEVQILQNKTSDLNLELERLLLSCRLYSEDTNGIIGLFRMGIAAERIAHAASEIAQIVLRGIEPHPVLRMMIESADKTVDEICVSEDSPLVNKTLKDAQIPEETGWWVLAIKRGDRWIKPKASIVLQKGDQIIASGYADGEEDLKQLLSGSKLEEI
jgi:uncharacterized protein with PhoU and TrkA domain